MGSVNRYKDHNQLISDYQNADTAVISKAKEIFTELSNDMEENLFGLIGKIRNSKKHLENIEELIAVFDEKVKNFSAYIKEFSENMYNI